MAEGNQVAKYNIYINQAQRVAIGDNAVCRDGQESVTPSSPPFPASRDALLAAIHQASTELRTWLDKIAGVHIERVEVQQIVDWALTADPKQRLGMLLDQPGGGKTVIMHDVLMALEAASVPVLAIKADALSGVKTRDDLVDRLGLPAPVEECACHLATEGLFVVILDQLDALSLTLSRDQATLDVMMSVLARLSDIESVRIIASCRTFDLNNDPRLSTIKIDRRFQLQPLTAEQINPVLQAIGIDPDRLLPAHRQLIAVPLHLDIYARIVEAAKPDSVSECFSSLQDLYQALWRRRMQVIPPKNPAPKDRIGAIYCLVEAMQANRQLMAPVAVLDDYSEAAGYLERVGFIRQEGNNWLFFHQTFFDYCYARRFVAQNRSLSQEILAGSQGLFERSQMVQVLAYLRGSGAAAYRRELTALLFADNLRVHLRLLLLSWFGSLPDPTQEELGIARRLMTNINDQARFLQAARDSNGWFVLLNEAVLPSLLRSDNEQLLSAVVYYLRSAIQHQPESVMELLRHYLGKDEAWDARIAFCLSGLDDWNNHAAVEMLCDLLRRGRMTHQESHCLYQMAHSNPAGGCQALRVYLDRRLADLMAEEQAQEDLQDTQEARLDTGFSYRYAWKHRLLNEHSIDEVMEQAAQICPEAIVEHLLPWFVRVAQILSSERVRADYYPSDLLFDYGWNDDHLLEGAVFARRIARSLSVVAQKQPAVFREIASRLAKIESHAVHRVLVRAYLSQPEVYTEDIFCYLIADRRRLYVGESGGYDSCCLFGAVFRHLDSERREALEQIALSYVLDEEKRDLKFRGLSQFRLLKSVSPDLLSVPARRRLRELEHKFPGYELRPPEGARGGWVGPPIDRSSQDKMSDDNWLNAMRTYDDSGRRPHDFLKGGVQELARSFQEQVKSAPERFYRLAKRFDDSISLYYINSAITGLADSDAPAEWVFDLVCQFAPCIKGEFRRYVCWSLQKRANCDVPDDLLDLMTDWALHDTDPSEELWRVSPNGGAAYFGGDPHDHGINTNRGSALRAVCHCVTYRDPPQIERAFHLLEQAASDSSTAVRTCIIDSLGPLLSHDDERALAIFQRAMDGHPRLLQCDIVLRFLYWVYYDHFPKIRSLFEALLAHPDDVARQAGARLVCLAAFHYPEANELAERAMNGDVALRRGAAQVYARNLEQPDLEDTCRRYLLKLMHDPDEQVRRNVCSCFEHLKPEHLHRLRSFIEAFLASPALSDEAGYLLRYLVPLATNEHELALTVTECILDTVGQEVVDIRTSRALLERDLVRLPLTVYTHAIELEIKSRAMALFERMLELGSREAHQALADWDRR